MSSTNLWNALYAGVQNIHDKFYPFYHSQQANHQGIAVS